MNASGHRLHLRLFLEGIEVPVISANVVASEGSAATAQIEIVPTDRALTFYPRTVVHLFYLDSEELAYEAPKAAESAEELERHYKLLFMGELFSYTYSKAGTGSRSVILQCLDFSNYWDTTYLYQLTYAPGDGENFAIGNQGNFLTAADAPFSDLPTQGPAEQVVQALKKVVQNPGLSEIGQNGLGGLLAILEKLGGVANLYRGLNDFSTISERRVRLMDQIGADSGDTAKAIFEMDTFEKFLKERLESLGTVVAFRDVINLINGGIYYSVVPMPVGRYIKGTNVPLPRPDPSGGARGNTKGVNPNFLVEIGKVFDYLAAKGLPGASVHSGLRTESEQGTVNSSSPSKSQHLDHEGRGAMAIDLTHEMIHGLGNYPSLSLGAIKEKYASGNRQPYIKARILMEEDYTVTIEELAQQGKLTATDVAALDTAAAFYAELAGYFKGKGAEAVLTWGGNFKKRDPVWSTYPHPDGGGFGFDPSHIEATNPQDPRWESSATPVQSADVGQPRERLISHIFRPDVWFVSPPLCNIVFPDDYVSVQYDRQLMREITRLELETYDAMLDQPESGVSNKVIRRHYFAPMLGPADPATQAQEVVANPDRVEKHAGEQSNDSRGGAPALNGRQVAPTTAPPTTLQNMGIGSSTSMLYPHEKFSGIIPRLEHMHEVAFHAAHKLHDETAAGALAGGTKDPFAEYASRTAAFHFLRYRYAARSMSVSGKFLPRLVVGFPGLVVNRPHTIHDVSPTHFCGLITSINHMVNQQGGSTSYSMAYARPHKPDAQDDFVRGIDSQKTTVRKVVTTTVVVGSAGTAGDQSAIDALQALLGASTDLSVAAIAEGDARLKDMRGPRGLQVLSVEMVRVPAFAVPAGDALPTATSLLLELSLTTVGGSPAVAEHATAAADRAAKEHSPALANRPVEAKNYYTFSSATFQEADDEAAVVALEDAIRPPWFSSDYQNNNIGKKIYEPLLGCKALVDYLSLSALQANARKATPPDPVPLSVSVTQAASGIVRAYSAVAEAGGEGAEYSWTTTKRAGARLSEVMNSFHAAACGPFEALDGLGLAGVSMPPPWSAGENVDPGAVREVSAAFDPRKERWGVVSAYRTELAMYRGLRG